MPGMRCCRKMLLKWWGKLVADHGLEYVSLIRVDYLRSSVPCNGTFERINAVWRIEWVVQAPAHNALWWKLLFLNKAPVLKSGSIIKMVIDMINNAMKKIPNHEGLILHSDQWWHYQHVKYQNTLKKNGIEQSMSRKGNCLDNAMMEYFFWGSYLWIRHKTFGLKYLW